MHFMHAEKRLPEGSARREYLVEKFDFEANQDPDFVQKIHALRLLMSLPEMG